MSIAPTSARIRDTSVDCIDPCYRLTCRPSICTTTTVVTLKASILVADDDETSARYLKRLLTKEGHTVSVVDTADEVLEACQNQPPDLVVLDLLAPRGHG